MNDDKDAHDHLVSAAGRAIAQGMTKEQFLKAASQFWDIRAEMAGNQEPLGREFEQVYDDNAEELYRA